MTEFDHKKPSAEKLIETVEDILDDEAKGFVVRLWKMVKCDDSCETL